MTVIAYKPCTLVDVRGKSPVNAADAQVGPASVAYFGCINITHYDSVYGITVYVHAYRYGNDVTLTVQETEDPDATWTDVSGASGLLSSGGTAGSPVEVKTAFIAKPASGSTLKAFVRVKIETEDTGTDCFVSVLTYTRRGGSM